jgi:hypothetical protein
MKDRPRVAPSNTSAPRSKEWYERAANAENEWVRTVILQKDHITHGDAAEVAEKACKMARQALGDAHPAYGVALLNLAVFQAAVRNDWASSDHYFEQARVVLGPASHEESDAL